MDLRGVSRFNVFVQNVSTRTARWRETRAAPAASDTASGHTLAPGAGIVIRVFAGCPFWWWSPTGAAIAVSEAKQDY